jgi:hypothetical protein
MEIDIRTTTCLKMAAFWDIASSSLIEVEEMNAVKYVN